VHTPVAVSGNGNHRQILRDRARLPNDHPINHDARAQTAGQYRDRQEGNDFHLLGSIAVFRVLQLANVYGLYKQYFG